jgi:hypothetical protein
MTSLGAHGMDVIADIHVMDRDDKYYCSCTHKVLTQQDLFLLVSLFRTVQAHQSLYITIKWG